jgi:DNA-binding CsgD family transcriptional regulator
MIGTTDHRFLIDRIGTDAEEFLGYQPAEMLGRPILSLVDGATMPALLDALEAAVRTQLGVSAVVVVRSKTGSMLRCDAVVVPLVPEPTCAFAFILEEADVESTSLTARRRLIERLYVDVAAIDPLTNELSIDADLPDVSQLTARERQIVRMLVSGDRVRAIADRLFLSPSTIRNHLSSVFRKLGVGSQQELVDRFRTADSGTESGHAPTNDP